MLETVRRQRESSGPAPLLWFLWEEKTEEEQTDSERFTMFESSTLTILIFTVAITVYSLKQRTPSSLSHLLAYSYSCYPHIIHFISVISVVISLLSLLILVVWIFLSFLLISLTKGFQFYWSFQRNNLFWRGFFTIVFLFWRSLIFTVILIMCLLVFMLDLICSSFSIILRWKLRLLTWGLISKNIDIVCLVTFLPNAINSVSLSCVATEFLLGLFTL